MRLTHLVAEIIHSFLAHLSLVDDERVLEISTFDESDTQQRFYLTNETERTSRSNLFGVLRQVGQRSMLLTQKHRTERDRHIHLVVVARLNTEDISVLGDILDRLGHYIHVLLGILLYQTNALYLFDEITCATVQNRHLRCIYIDDTVIYSHGIQRTQSVLYRGDLPFTAL